VLPKENVDFSSSGTFVSSGQMLLVFLEIGYIFLLCGFAKFEGQSIFDGEERVLDGFILGRNWQ
jgi:hypothetical protein